MGREVGVQVVQVDVSNEESVKSMVETVVERWGRVDYAVNAAGMSTPQLRRLA